jgi:hypothetical protein
MVSRSALASARAALRAQMGKVVMMTLNINGLSMKRDIIESYMCRNNIMVACMQETLLKEGDRPLRLNSFDCFHSWRRDGRRARPGHGGAQSVGRDRGALRSRWHIHVGQGVPAVCPERRLGRQRVHVGPLNGAWGRKDSQR